MATKVVTWVDRMAIPSMLFFGTCTVVSGKFLFEMYGLGKKFEKPWWQVVTMFLGMLSCLVVYYLTRVFKQGSNYQPLDAQAKKAHLMDYLRILPPGMCDLTATGLMNVGLLFISASIWQLLRGSMVIFSAILSIIFLHRRLFSYHWLGISSILCAMLAVGVACIKSGAGNDSAQSDSSKSLLGMILVVVAQVIQASQIVIEEFLLKNVKAPASLIVGIEGFWGTVVTCVIVLPILSLFPEPYGEDTLETFRMMKDNNAIIYVTIFYILVILGYNLAGMCVTQQFTAIHRTILEAMRTLCIWIVDLFIYYAITESHGEKWTVWSWLELAGFGLLVTGTFIYNRFL